MDKKSFIIILAALIVAGIAIFGILHTNDSWLQWVGQYDYTTTSIVS